MASLYLFDGGGSKLTFILINIYYRKKNILRLLWKQAKLIFCDIGFIIIHFRERYKVGKYLFWGKRSSEKL